MHELQTQLEGYYHCRSYSGRGMFGKECLGVEIGAGPNMLLQLGAWIGDELTQKYKAKQDTMGENIIVYWPDVPYTKEADDACTICGGIGEECTCDDHERREQS